jgi:PAS domain S-box-containing protein
MTGFEMAPANAGDELGTLRRRMAEVEAELDRYKQNEDSAEERFRQLADASPLMIWMSDVDARCHFFSRAWLEFRGRTLEEEAGNGWTTGLHVDDRDLCIETYLKSFAARHRFRMQFRLRRSDGEFDWVESRGYPRYTGDLDFAGFIGTAFDLRGRRRGYFVPDEESVRMVFSLTERERQVLVLIASGATTRIAAERLGITYKTADSHRSRILEKLGIHETASLVRYAIRAGLIEP